MSERLPLADELAAVFARMSGLIPSMQTDGALDLVTSLASEVLPGTAGAGVTLMDSHGDRVTAAATDPVVGRADEMQYELGEGPCLTAWEQHSTVRIDDLAVDERWPRWTAAAAATGLRSCLSAALMAGDLGLGAIKVYSLEPATYGSGSEHVMQMFAAQAATLVSQKLSGDGARQLSDELRGSIRSRDTVSLAKGIVMHRDGVAEEDAFITLLALARHERTSLHEAAEDLARSTPRRRR